MPHSSKKAKKTQTSKSSRTITYVVVGVIIAVVAAAAGYAAYSAFRSTSSLTTDSNLSTSTSYTTSTGVQYYAVIDTTQGVMEALLFPSVAPKTVANFVSLANSGFYNDLVWHRIVAGFAIQTGDPTSRNGGGTPSTWGQTGSSTTVPLETNSTVVAEGYVNDEGYLGLARSQSLDSGSSQFYINLANNTSLNGQYTVFGKLISGMNVALAIGNLQVYSQCQTSGGAQCWPVNPSQAMVLSITIKNTP